MLRFILYESHYNLYVNRKNIPIKVLTKLGNNIINGFIMSEILVEFIFHSKQKLHIIVSVYNNAKYSHTKTYIHLRSREVFSNQAI